jgi:A/G-specific adenine glycosylase
MPPSLTPLQQDLLNWFNAEKRDLPWRRDYLPYQVWISEIMLQQTQMDRVVHFYQRWMEHFPNLATLARASEQRVLKCWEGLGYYSRARNILKTAQIIVKEHGGELPRELSELLKLPGIGPYTAGAIASIAFNHDEPLVDANIARLFARLFDIAEPLNSPPIKKGLWQKAAELLPAGHARAFNQALMELGALVCTPKSPSCPQCPLKTFCQAHDKNCVDQRPVLGPGKKIITIEMATGILRHNNRLFIQQRLADDVWGGLWEFPGGRLQAEEKAHQAVIREFCEETGFRVKIAKKITTTIHHYTRYKVILHCFTCHFAGPKTSPTLTAAQECRWVSFAELDHYAFPAGHRKLIDFMKKEGLA